MTDTQAVRQLFDRLAHDYDQHLPFFTTFGRDLVRWCDLRPGQRVLDVAAGRGAVAGPAAHAVGTRGAVLAIDNAPAMLRALATDHPDLPQLATRVMDAHHLDLPETSFDVVACGFALHFLDDPAQAITEAHRVLRPGGLFAFSTPPTDHAHDGTRDSRWDFYQQLVDDMSRRSSPTRRPDPFTPPPRPLPELCAEAGFVDLQQRTAHATFALRDPQHYWGWSMSHGLRGFIDSLGSELAAEFQARLLAGLERLHADGGITLDSTVAFTRVRKASG